LHLAAGEAIERFPEGEREHRAAELARHFLEADEPERAIPYALQAGAAAEATAGYSEAEWQYRIAAELARERDDPLSEAQALEKLGHILVYLGRADSGAEELERAIELYHDQSQLDAEARVIAELGLLSFELGRVDLTIERVRGALAALEPQGPSATLSRLQLAEGAYYWRKGRPQEALASGRRGLAIARQVDDELVLIEMLVYLAVPERRLGRVQEALAMLEEARTRAAARGDLFWQAWAELIFGDTFVDAGQLSDARDAYRRAYDLAHRLQNPGRIAWSHTGLALTLQLSGDWGTARQVMEGAGEWMQLAGDAGSVVGTPLLLGQIYTLLGRWDEAEQIVERVWDQAHNASDPLLWGQAATSLAELERLRGNLDAALGWVERAGDNWYADARVRGWVLLERGCVAEAEAVARTGLEQVGNVRVYVPGWHLLLGASLAEQRRWENAQEQLDAGLAVAREIRMPYEEGLVLYYRGRMDVARGDRGAGRRGLEAALTIFQRLGAQPYIDRAERALREARQE
jgi:tetratricopeptide (TPR) repeat protein